MALLVSALSLNAYVFPAVRSTTPVRAAVEMNDAAAKAAWLSKLNDQPAWSTGAAQVPVPAPTPLAAAPVAIPAMGDDTTAKAAWLALLDKEPSWKGGGAVASAAAAGNEAAKAAWLASLDKEPSWTQAVPFPSSSDVPVATAPIASAAAAPPAAAYETDEAAKQAWLAKLDNQPSWAVGGEAAAKAAWLAKVDSQPSWTTGASAPVSVPVVAPVAEPVAAPQPVAFAPVADASEAAAKAAWLARLDIQPTRTAVVDVDAAKAAWLASIEQEPSWMPRGAAPVPVPVAETPAPTPTSPAEEYVGKVVPTGRWDSIILNPHDNWWSVASASRMR